MRVTPIGLYETDAEEAFDLACEIAAVTHAGAMEEFGLGDLERTCVKPRMYQEAATSAALALVLVSWAALPLATTRAETNPLPQWASWGLQPITCRTGVSCPALSAA
jgi:hypothetical protein